MSFDRQRAHLVSSASTFRAGRPAAARAWLVRVTRRASSAAEKALASQARTDVGKAIETARAATRARPPADRRGFARGACRGTRLRFMAPGLVTCRQGTLSASTDPVTADVGT